MSLTIKAFLQRDGKWDAEIRRCQVPADVSSSFTYLSKKLCDIFPSLTATNFSVFWKDSEGDHVSFSTDEELMEALGYVTDGVFKIYLILNADGGQKESEVVHPGVVCDGCESSIRGPRFKCMTCPDYDLCKGCEGQGMHVEHDMIKIQVPGTFPAFAGFPGFPGFGGPQGAHGPHGPGPHGQFAPPPHFRRWMQKFMKRWHNRNTPGWKEGDKCEKEEQEGEKMEQDAEKEKETGDASSGEEFLRSVGETVSAMLDPFGIDVDVSVDTHKEDEAGQKDETEQENKRQGQGQGQGRCQGRRGRPGRGRCGGRGGQGFGYGGPFDMYAFMSGCPMAQGQWDCGPRGKGKCNGDEEKCKKNKCNGKGKAEKRNEKEDPAQTVSPPQKVPESQDKMVVENQEPKGRDKDAWTLLNMNSEPSGVATNVPDSQRQPLIPQPGPTAPPQQSQGPLYPPADPKIAEALQQMTAMGFTNEGGWLTNLLEAKEGDIVQVLDAIRPQRARTNADGTMA